MRATLFLLIILLSLQVKGQKIIAHRGASDLAPENTVASAKLAWELGADAVECDIYLSKDNRVMVIHDHNTKRTCSGKKNLIIAKTPSLLLRELDAGSWKDEKYSGEKIPFLSEIIETIPEGKTLVVEIKCGPEIIPALQRSIEKSGKGDRLVFISFGWDTILETHKTFPENKCYWLSATKSCLKKKMKGLADEGLAGVNLKYSIIDKEVATLAKSLNLELLTWTVDDPQEAKRLTNLGVVGITTNKPGWMRKELDLF
ncbi:MAG: glycerophosphodiester phosphodiesterase [Draconibacterium sp.]|nr:MAG: glycerophosphodiester phosphodiesterase [Draconibacterium sp.]